MARVLVDGRIELAHRGGPPLETDLFETQR
jgi:hypothetical protein